MVKLQNVLFALRVPLKTEAIPISNFYDGVGCLRRRKEHDVHFGENMPGKRVSVNYTYKVLHN
jgi:hypothetical protein